MFHYSSIEKENKDIYIIPNKSRGSRMIKQLSCSITAYFVNENIIKSEEEEIYRYGIQRLLIKGITIITVCAISTVLQKRIETVFFFIGLMPIRAVAGGLHASTPRRCNLLSFIVYLSGIAMIDLISENASLWLYVIMSTVILLSIYFFAPVDHLNRRLTEAESRESKKISLALASLIVISMLICAVVFGANNLIVSGTLMGAFIASASIIIGKYKRRGERNEENEMAC